MKRRFTVFLLLTLYYLAVNAQECFITITRPASDTIICQGDSVYLRSEGSCNIFLNGGFENGLGPGWTSSYPTPIYTDEGCDDEYYPFGPGPNGNYGWFGPTGQMVKPRHITTDTFDLSLGGACNLKFWMRYGRAAHSGNSDCEDPNNPDNGLHLQYSNDFGTTWFDFPGVNQYPTGPNEAYPPFHTLVPGSGGYWQPTQENPVGGLHVPERYDTSAVYWWHNYSCNIPPAAMTSATMFRFMQDFHQSAKSDTWGIDEVMLWCADNQDVFWSHGPMVFNPPDPVAPNVTTEYIVTVYDSLGNFASDTVTITVIPIPAPDLGPDTVICDDGVNAAYFDAGAGFEHYVWNTGDTTQVIKPNLTGWYSVTATNYNCSGTDSVYLQMVPQVIGDAGSDEMTCEETPFDLSASSVPPSASDYSSILWYGGLGSFDDPTAITPVYTPAPGEVGQVTLTMVAYGNSPCGNDTSQMILDVIIIPDPDLGPDTSVCDNGVNTAYFDAGPGYEHYLWNTGDTTQIITPNVTGWYIVTATNAICSGIDSVFLQMVPQVMADAGSDEVTCEETPFDLSNSIIPPTASDYSSILWYGGLGTFSDPTTITPVYTPAPGETGQVILTMVAYGNSPCGNDTSQMILDVIPNAVANAGSDENICQGESFDFSNSSIVPFAANYDTLYWTGGAGSFIDPTAVVPVYIPDPAELGQITLTLVTSGLISNCDSVDEMILTIYPEYFTLTDTTICFLDSIFLQGNWQNITGTYYDTLQTVHACDSVIQTNLTVRPEIDYDFTIDPLSVCLSEITSFFQSGSSTITDFLWDFGDGQYSTLLNPTHVYSSTGDFYVTLSYTDDDGCSDEKIHVANVMLQAQVDFISEPAACLYEPTYFNGFSNFNITQWDWDFGDGQIGSGQYVLHSYSSPGTYNVTLTGYTISGCEGTMMHSIYIPPSPVADFTHYIVYCDSIQFIDLSYHPNGYNIVEWLWDFGDGGTSILQHPWHQYDNSGIFNVTLIATSDSAGLLCTDTITKSIMVPPKPTVYFTWDGDPTCFGTPTSFYGTSGANIVSWNWDFGDGVTATGQQPVHLYTSIDTFDVVLTVTDANGCADSIIHSVSVVDVPEIDFTVLPNPTCRNSLTLFEGYSPSSIENWNWDFGDGSFGVGQSTAHTYLYPGTYYAILSINDTVGCDNSMSYPVVVNHLPTADFDFNETTCSNDTVYFTDFSSTPNGYILQWDWDLGDGTSITIQYPDDPDISHVYSMGGTYTITLTVLDSDSCSHSYSRQIEIDSSPIANFNHPPACDGSPVYFTDLSSINGGSPLLTWYWEFDDPNSGSNTSNLQSPAHLFSSSGVYNVSLVVTNLINCSDTVVKVVEVNGLPDVDFLISTDTACVDAEVEFTGLSPEAISYWWDFGDGGTSVQMNPVHVYQDPGDYLVTLTVVDGYGCTNETSQILTVDPLPWAAFDHSELTCTNVPVLFNDESSATAGYLAEWHWYFGDGTDTVVYYPDNPEVSHTYANSDIYTASLVITSSNGCVDSTSRDIHIIQGPVSSFAYSDNTCADESIDFFDLSYAYGVSIISWQWDFGDPSSGSNNFSNLQNPTHEFSEAGLYTVTLQVTMVGGCYAVSSEEVIVEPGPPVYFYTGQSTCYSDLTYFFTDPDSTNIAEVVDFLWEFDDPASGANNLSALQDPTHMFTSPGTYDVSLTITNIDGCQSTITRQILLGEKPFAEFAFAMPCVGDSTNFIDQSISGGVPVTSWLWNFDDPASGPGNISTLQNPNHKFSETGAYSVHLVVTDINGCIDSIDKSVQINNSPVAQFSYSSACDPPGTIIFKDLSYSGTIGQAIVDWFWELEPGINSYLANPHHTYEYTDTCFQVSLTVTDQQGCQNTTTQEVCINGPLQLAIESDDACLGERSMFHTFYQVSNDTVVEWVWDFNDGSPAIHTVYDTIGHQFSQSGIYTVKVSAFNQDGCEFTAHEETVVHANPLPDFTASIANCNEPTQFTDQSSAPGSLISSWSWNFGDGEYSNAPSPIHQYGIQDSIYLVTLTVTNAEGCADSIQKEVIKGACLEAAFEPVLESVCNNLAACFVDQSALHSAGNPIIKWDWTFGDGTTESYSYYRDSICHDYNNSGSYEVELVVTAIVNGTEQRDSTTRIVQFAMAPTTDFTMDNPCVNNGTKFHDETSGNGIMVTSWKWDFGDYYANDDTSSLQNPTYNYIYPGIYQVKLITANSFGCSDTISREIEVFPSPQVDFSYSSACAGKKMIFVDQSSVAVVPITRWSWDFGDVHSTADTSNLQNPKYAYKQEGNYPVILEITDENHCEDIIRKVITVNPSPISQFNTNSNYEGIYGNVLLENLSQGASAYMWDFGNGETSELENPKVFYNKNGTYIIQLVSLNEYDCYDTAYQELEILIQGLYVPNAFVPEGENPELRTFMPVGINLRKYKIEVYNRWGSVIWSSMKLNDEGRPAEGWDGTYKGKPMPVGDYIWLIEAEFKNGHIWQGTDVGDGNSKTYGTVTLIR